MSFAPFAELDTAGELLGAQYIEQLCALRAYGSPAERKEILKALQLLVQWTTRPSRTPGELAEPGSADALRGVHA